MALLGEFTWRALSVSDLPAVVELERSSLVVDGGLPSLFQPEAISERYFPGTEGGQLGALGADGRLIAAVAVHVARGFERTALMTGQVRPDHRGKGLGRHIVRWATAGAAALLADAAASGGVVQLRNESLTEAADQLFRDEGFTQVDASLVMRRDLRQPLPFPALTPEIELVAWSPRLAGQFAQVYEPAFSDRPGFPGWSADEWIARATANDLVANWSLLARTNGMPVGFVIGCIDESTDPPGGFIWQVGVASGERLRRIGSNLLVESMRRMQAAGSHSAELTVHVDNPGAIRTYQQLHFETVGRRGLYERRIPA